MLASLRGRRVVMVGAALLVACGGGGSTGPDDDDDDDNNGGGNGNPRFTATVDGAPFTASAGAGSILAIQHAPKSGGYLVSGQSGTGTILLTLNYITGPGTFPLGVDAVTVPGGFAGITTSVGGWTTPISGAAGTVTITALTPTRIAGTFSFTGSLTTGGDTGTKTVTAGQFDAPMAANSPIAVLTDSMGSTMAMSLGGQAWNAAIVSGQTTQTHMALSGINNLQTMIFTIPKPTATGTYQLSNQPGSILMAWDPNAVAPAGARCCYGVLGDVGTLTITHLSTTRVRGSVTATLTAQPGTAASGTLTVSGGTFNIGLYHNP